MHTEEIMQKEKLNRKTFFAVYFICVHNIETPKKNM